MSAIDYKKPRKSDFPQCAKDALTRIGKNASLSTENYVEIYQNQN